MTENFLAKNWKDVPGRTASPDRSLDLAVVGSGISGLSAAWLLSKRRRVVLYEADNRLGGHSHTVDVAGLAVDTGFIVFNETTYPNLTALFEHIGVATRRSDMSFAVSLDDGRLEHSGTGILRLSAADAEGDRRHLLGSAADLAQGHSLAGAPLAARSTGHARPR